MSKPDPTDVTERYARVQFRDQVLVGTDTLTAWSRQSHFDGRQPRDNSANVGKPIRLLELGSGWLGLALGDDVIEVPMSNIVSRHRAGRKDGPK